MVIYIYALTSFSIVSVIYATFSLFINPQFYFDSALFYSLIMVLFCVYVAYRNSGNNLKSLFWRIPMFLLVFLIGYLGISIASVGILFLTGEISIQDFTPNQ
ncbi:MAG: hypothetical protein ACO3VF_07420 [Tamlana sp.]